MRGDHSRRVRELEPAEVFVEDCGDAFARGERVLSIAAEKSAAEDREETVSASERETDDRTDWENRSGYVGGSDDDVVVRRARVYDSILQRVFQSWFEKCHRWVTWIGVRKRADAGDMRDRFGRESWIGNSGGVGDDASDGAGGSTDSARH